jgi:hypothetical protein
MEKDLHQENYNLLNRALPNMRYKPPRQYYTTPVLSYFKIINTYLQK